MRVVQLSTSDQKGGAAAAAYRLHRGLRQVGVDCEMRVRDRGLSDPLVQRVPRSKLWAAAHRIRGNRMRAQLPPAVEYASSPHSASSKALAESLADFDVINLHWVADFIDWPSFFPFAHRSSLLVWTLHDMNPFLGGEHYAALPDTPADAVPAGLRRRFERWHALKKRIIQRIPREKLVVVAPSRWLTDEAAKSEVFQGFECRTIPNSLDTEHFSPRDRALARRAFDLPVDGSVVAFVSDTLDNPRKGSALLREAIALIKQRRPDTWLVSAGSGDPWGDQHRHVGRLQDERLISLLYSAADVFAIPSLMDNLPNTMLEAMASGVPCVGFDTGGIPDLVVNGETGMTVPLGDVNAFADAVLTLLGDPDRTAALGCAARERIERHHTLAAQGEAYRSLYEERLAHAANATQA